MQRRSGSAPALLVAVALVSLVGGVVGTTSAAFSSQTQNPGDSYAAAPDFRAPSIGALAIGKTLGGKTGYIKQGGTYYVFASVSDSGNPSSGISSVTANVANVTAGQTSVTMTAGSYTAGGVSYNYRSASITANAGLSAGVKTFSVTANDTASNGPATTNGSVTVDNTAPAASDNQITNGGATLGRPEQGDVITLTFTGAVDPESIIAGWSGSSTAVTVRIANNGGSNDTVTIANAANSTQLPIGSVNAIGDYVTAATVFAGTMSFNGTNTILTITLGTLSSGTVRTDNNNRTSTWTPSASAYDYAGNACSTTVNSETGTADRNF